MARFHVDKNGNFVEIPISEKEIEEEETRKAKNTARVVYTSQAVIVDPKSEEDDKGLGVYL